jgi:hypothetical protein
MSSLIRTHHGHFAVVAADGKVYVAAHAERACVGGGLAWWDPKTQTAGGLREPFELHDVAGLATADVGRLVVYSSRTVKDPATGKEAPEAKLFIYDTREGKTVREVVPAPGGKSAGPIVEAANGVIVGASPGDGAASTLYAVEVATGKVLRQRDIAAQCGGHFGLGPDGRVWTFLSDGTPEGPRVLSRIDPNTFDVTLVGRLESPGRIAFVGRDVYLAGQPSIRRIAGLVPAGGR